MNNGFGWWKKKNGALTSVDLREEEECREGKKQLPYLKMHILNIWQGIGTREGVGETQGEEMEDGEGERG